MHQFIAIVGPAWSGKTSLMKFLSEVIPTDMCDFLCDSNGSNDETLPHNRFVKKTTDIAKSQIHNDTTPHSQIAFFWSRLIPIIEHDIAPSLASDKSVIINGFGATVLAHALCNARSEQERIELFEFHKSMIQHNVLRLGIKPPKYIWLQPSASVAFSRSKNDNELPNIEDPYSYIQQMNDGFELYGKLTGQEVIPIDADQPFDMVCKEVLTHINLPYKLAYAV